jgi:hypothetical protein
MRRLPLTAKTRVSPLNQDTLNEVERKLYTVAIGSVVLAVMIIGESHFLPNYSAQPYTLHSLLRVFRKPVVLFDAEIIAFQVLAALLCLPFLKATRTRLSFVDALIVSAPITYVHALAFCDRDMRYVVPIVAMPLLIIGIFHLFPLRSIPSLVDDVPAMKKPLLHLGLATFLAFQFFLLFCFLSGASPPFPVKPVYVVFFVGIVTALAARIRPHILRVLIAVIVGMFNLTLLSALPGEPHWQQVTTSLQCQRDSAPQDPRAR